MDWNSSNPFSRSTPNTASTSSAASPLMSLANLKPQQKYTGNRVAGLSDGQKQAISLAKSAPGTLGKYYDSANAAFGKSMDYLNQGEKYIAPSTERYSSPYSRWTDASEAYMNPFIKGALDVSARELKTGFEKDQLTRQDKAISRGAFGGSRLALEEAEGKKNFDTQLSDLYSKGMADAYDRGAQIFAADETRNMNQFNSEQDRYQKAADLFRGYSSQAGDVGSDYIDLASARDATFTNMFNRLLQGGGIEQETDQRQKTADYEDFVGERDYAINVAKQLAAIMNGSPSNGAMHTTQGGNSFGQTVGGIGSLAGGIGSLASAFGPAAPVALPWLSDRRTKTEVVKLGERNGLPFYRFRYVGEKEYQFGHMADEVEKVLPEAVITRDDGMKMVDYGMIAARA